MVVLYRILQVQTALLYAFSSITASYYSSIVRTLTAKASGTGFDLAVMALFFHFHFS